jgi:sugar phosphate isomerase/epimerase
MKNYKTGIQLYTVREALGEDFKGTMAKLAKLGCDGVEFAGNNSGMNPEELKSFLDDLGLQACGWHTSLEDIGNADSDVYQYAKALGFKYVTTSLCGKVESEWLETIEQVKVAAKVAKDQGLQFTYHNHAQEFQKIDGEYALDLLYAATDPEEVKAELDTYWVKKGGEDPASYLRKYADRLPQIHMKDMDGDSGTFVALGTGSIDFDSVKEVAIAANSEWLIYEQDSCGDRDVMECAAQSIQFINQL